MRAELAAVLADNGFPCTYSCLDKLCQYYNILLEWNAKMNLTALTEPKDFIYKHVCDSILPAKLFPVSASHSLLDLGTGAGFPGLPLKILYPQIQLTLMEAAAKKAFLRHCCQELAVEADILWDRAESLGQGNMRESFPLITTRAVASLAVVCEYCLPLLEIGGFFLALKGPGGSQEAEESQRALELLGGKLTQVYFYSLPTGEQRSLVVVEKILPTPVQYPRRPGAPAKKPL